MRRSKSPEMQKHVEECELKKRRNPASQRKLEFAERQHDQREAKKVKREAL